MFAHYFASKTVKFLYISLKPSLATSIGENEEGVMMIEVLGKVEARKLAAFYGAKPWNF